MSHARPTFPHTLRLLALAAALVSGLAHADDYSDVNQLLRSGKTAEALARSDQYLAGKPRDPQMRFLRGVILTESGRTNDAIASFLKLTEDYPELPEPYNNLAVLYAGQSQFDKARAALEMAIRTNPSYATAHENLGDVYAKLASQAYSKALQLDAANTAVQPKLALIRELFAPAPAKGGRPATPAAAAPVPAASTTTAKSPAAAPAPAAAAAPALAPAPAVTAKAPAAAPAATPAAAPATTAAPAAAAGTKDVESAVQAWATAWSSKDVGGYLAAYSKEFDPPGNQSRKAWEDERRQRIVGKSRISVRLSDVSVSVNGSKAVARFKQAYSADSLNVTSRKTLDLQKVGDRWVIVRESTG
ncbi:MULTISPECIES: nuclear transport factor 2 family protein [Ramlibacter]|uniref:Tetratricopeptide repeat protein n=1 Tax=Ramlibacter pinisoli TaxID=2682844 RepID=A0A6N8IQK3_9BURK|nr:MULTISPECIES: nuclear transport factor 2 family protein [Ramlibacter]MBA2963459.1 tetratricopeptide repeat protein [Ramlibacter sp. CGMCC 1.13660]MVQ28426.1 tetratricopeptide repeat protein [Ramlibacter pinisoli]